MELPLETDVLYQELLQQVQAFGPARVDEKKTSIHLNNRAGFAGIHPRKRFLYLNIVSAQPIQSSRISKTEQVSKSRFHNELKIERVADIDGEVLGWLRDAYHLMA